MKRWLIGALNATLAGIFVTGGASIAGVTLKQGAIIVGVAAFGSFGKWMAQHPIPDGDPQ